jgi:hypothetical protein
MAIASSGAIRLTGDIGAELGQGAGAVVGLKAASIGNYASINTNNAVADRPDGSAPHKMSEFYSYDHSAAASGFGGIFVDDFYTTGSNDPMDARVAYATTGLQDGESFPTDGDGNTVTTRPVWTFATSTGTSHESNDRIRVSNTNNSTHHAQWRTTNVPPEDLGSGGGTINIEFSFFMSSSNNKDLILYVEAISQGNGWANSNGLDNGYHFQWYDNTQAVRIRRRDSYSSITTLATSSSGKFTKGAWTTAKITIEDDGTLTIFCNGTSSLSTTSTTYQSFFPSGAGIRFMSAKAMATGQYSDIDWIKIWKTA